MLWNLVGSASVREIFYQYMITCVDTSQLRIGRAPMTTTKAEAAANQFPTGIKWLKTAVLDQPDCATHVPSFVGDDYVQRQAWENDKDKTTFKSRGGVTSYFQLQGDEYEQNMIA